MCADVEKIAVSTKKDSKKPVKAIVGLFKTEDEILTWTPELQKKVGSNINISSSGIGGAPNAVVVRTNQGDKNTWKNKEFKLTDEGKKKHAQTSMQRTRVTTADAFLKNAGGDVNVALKGVMHAKFGKDVKGIRWNWKLTLNEKADFMHFETADDETNFYFLASIFLACKPNIVSGCWLRRDSDGDGAAAENKKKTPDKTKAVNAVEDGEDAREKEKLSLTTAELKCIMKYRGVGKWNTKHWPEGRSDYASVDEFKSKEKANNNRELTVRHHVARCEILHVGPEHGLCARPSHYCWGTGGDNAADRAAVSAVLKNEDDDGAFTKLVVQFRKDVDKLLELALEEVMQDQKDKEAEKKKKKEEKEEKKEEGKEEEKKEEHEEEKKKKAATTPKKAAVKKKKDNT